MRWSIPCAPARVLFCLILPGFVLLGFILPTTSVAQQYLVTVQPIQVRTDEGTLEPGLGQLPAEPIPVEATNKIYAQADVGFEFLPTVYLDETDFLVIDSYDEFHDLVRTPGHGQHADSLVLNLWFVQEFMHCGPQGDCSLFLSYISFNGAGVVGEYVDVLFMVSHVLGYNFGLLNSLDEPLGRENLMHVIPYPPPSIDDIYPDGRGWAQLNADQITRIQASPFSVFQGLSTEPVPRPRLTLEQNMPNPFNPLTVITFEVGAGTARELLGDLVIYDLSGRRVRTLLSGTLYPGTKSVTWNGTDDAGARVASGVYLYQLRVGESVETKRMVLLK